LNSRPRFEDLVSEFQTMVARICASYERDRDLARDLAQDVWFAVWRALPGYRGEASLKTFVARIAQFRAISHATLRARLPDGDALTDDLIDQALPPETRAMASGDHGSLMSAVQRLPLHYRQPVVLMLEDFSPSEIAALLGLSANVVGVRLNRARNLLRELLQPEGR
jgi:RNA polymerase sigma-70 factor (ECF subfamily)